MVGSSSLHCGLIRGGEEPSSYPASYTVTIELRTIPAETDALILQDINTILASITKDRPTFRYSEPRIILSRPPHKLPVEHPLVQQTAAIATDVYRYRPSIESMAIWCDAALLGAVGIPTIFISQAGQGLHIKEE